jgi:capsular polysaccharide biosynthesis protein
MGMESKSNPLKKGVEGFFLIFDAQFLKKAGWGSLVSVCLVYLVTMPLIIKPLYESEAIVYAPLVILSQQLDQQGIGFASEREIDWYIQVLKSNQLTDSLVVRLQLDKADYPGEERNRLYSQLASRINIEKTRYGSVLVKVLDPDTKRAAAIANDVIRLGEEIKAQLLYPNRFEAMINAQSLFNQKVSEIEALEHKLDSIERSYSSRLKENLLYDKTLTVYHLELQELIARKNRFEKAKKDFETPLPKAYIVSEARPQPSPVKPNRVFLLALGVVVYLFLLTGLEIIKRDFKQGKT